MILATSPSKPFTYSAKGTPRRMQILEDYRDQIGALYTAVEQSSREEVPTPSSWDSDQTKAFVRAVVQRIVGQPISEDADLFRNGCDRSAFAIRGARFDSVKLTHPQLTGNLHSQHCLARITGALSSCG